MVKKSLDPTKDYYAILLLSEVATADEIKAAYRGLVRRHHPDTGHGDVAAFRLVQEAYEVLRNPALRRAYDRQRISRGLAPDAPLICEVTISRTSLPVTKIKQMLYALVDVRPNTNLAQHHQPLNLGLVVDCSTSMRGQRIRNVKIAVRNLVDSLQDEDRLALIAFNDRAKVLAASTPVRNKRLLHSSITRLVPGGGTEIYQGLVAGSNEVRRNASSRYLNHLILLTDGRTYGDEELSLTEARKLAGEGIGLSALGIGVDWNDLFLDALAQAGNGISEYIRTPAQLQELLQRRIRGLNSVLLRRACLRIKHAPSLEIQAVYRIEPYMKQLRVASDSSIPLGDLEDKISTLLLELTVDQPEMGRHRLARLEIEAASANEAVSMIQVRQDIEVDFVMSERELKPEIPMRIISLLSRLSIFRLQEQAWRDLEHGDVSHATRLLKSAATRLFDLGYHELAQAAMLEVNRVSLVGSPSSEGRKKLRYGTRSLTMHREQE